MKIKKIYVKFNRIKFFSKKKNDIGINDFVEKNGIFTANVTEKTNDHFKSLQSKFKGINQYSSKGYSIKFEEILFLNEEIKIFDLIIT